MEMLQLKRLKMNRELFFCLINLILQIEKFATIIDCDKLTSLDTVRASQPEIPDPNKRKLPKELWVNCSAN